MNDVMSVGIHRRLEEAMHDWLAPSAGKSCGCTRRHAECVFSFWCARERGHAHCGGLTEPMLGRRRKRRRGKAAMADSLDWSVGDAMARCRSRTTAFESIPSDFGSGTQPVPRALNGSLPRVAPTGGRLMVLLDSGSCPIPMMQKSL